MAGLRYLQTSSGRDSMMQNKPWIKANVSEARKSVGAKITLINKWKREHPGEQYKNHLDQVYGVVFPFCKCGCGLKVIKYDNNYLHGHNKPWLGKKRPSIPDEVKIKMRNGHLGKKYNVSEEGHKAIMENLKKMLTPENRMKTTLKLRGRKLSPEHIQHALKRRPITSLELAFQKIIDDNDLSYKFVGNGAFIIDGLNPDFININGKKIAIEVYARLFKQMGNRTIEKYKENRIKRLSAYGWKVYFFDETQVNADYVLSALGGDKN